VIGVGALLLAVAQFLPLFHTHVSTRVASLGSESVGSSHAYVVLALAALAVILGWGVILTGSRFALVLVGIVGAATLVVALGHDLSHARDQGIKILGLNDYAEAHNVVGSGLYVEILGALLLLMAVVGGFLFAGPALHEVAKTRPPRTHRPPRTPRARRGGAGGPRRRSRAETIGRRYDEE
jgi:hypothetical protein